jgi:hypothetical protein
MCNKAPYNPITGQQLTIEDIVTENNNEASTLPDNENSDNEFGSRGYDKQYDGAYAD